MENERKFIDSELSNVLKDFFDNYSKNENKAFTGIVEDNDDPDKLGRCKIRVYGVFDDENILTKDLPWSIPEQSFIGSNVGNFIVPPINTVVRIYFENNDIYSPVYTTKVLNRNQLPSEKNENYPNNMVFWETDNGSFFVINRETSELHFRHESGFFFTIDVDGNINIDNSNTETGDISIDIKGNVDLKTTGGDITLEASQGNIKLGGDSSSQPCNNLPFCLITGSPHSIGGQFPGTKNSALVKS